MWMAPFWMYAKFPFHYVTGSHWHNAFNWMKLSTQSTSLGIDTWNESVNFIPLHYSNNMMNFAFAIFFIGKHFAMNWDSTMRIVCRRIGNYCMHRGRKCILYQAIWSKCEWLIFTRRWNGKMKCPEWNCVLRYENDARTNFSFFFFYISHFYAIYFHLLSIHFHCISIWLILYYWINWIRKLEYVDF